MRPRPMSLLKPSSGVVRANGVAQSLNFDGAGGVSVVGGGSAVAGVSAGGDGVGVGVSAAATAATAVVVPPPPPPLPSAPAAPKELVIFKPVLAKDESMLVMSPSKARRAFAEVSTTVEFLEKDVVITKRAVGLTFTVSGGWSRMAEGEWVVQFEAGSSCHWCPRVVYTNTQQ